MIDRRNFLAAMGAAGLGAALTPQARSEAPWPAARPITLVVPFFAGSTTDVIGRTIFDKVGAALHQSVIVDDKPGAGGILGASYVAKSPPDGYTLLSGTISTHAIDVGLYRHLPYDPIKSFEPISLLGYLPNLLVVNAGLGLNSVADLIALLKRDKSRRFFGSAGTGTSAHLAGELLSETIGVPLTHVPYKGTPTAIMGVASGQLTFMFDQMTTAAPLLKSGKVKALAVTTEHRTPFMPQLPTMIEAGVPGFVSVSWHAAYAPKGTPRPIIDRLHAEIVKAIQLPDVKQRLAANLGMQLVGSTPAELLALMEKEIPRWTEVIKKAGITPY